MVWIEIGAGAGKNEIVRATQVTGGVLLATVFQRHSYQARGLRDMIVIDDEVTRALVFVAGATLEDLVPHRDERDSESDAETEKVSPVRVLTEADASVSRQPQ